MIIDLIANPLAGAYKERTISYVVRELTKNGCHVNCRQYEHKGDIERCAANCVADVLVIGGGDGSLNEALQGLVHKIDRRLSVSLIPFGTVNVLAKELNLPSAPEEITASILRKKTVRLHTGMANGKCFALMTSAGFDAEVVRNTREGVKRCIGRYAYVASALKQLLVYDWPTITIVADGLRYEAQVVIVSKVARYAGDYELFPNGRSDKSGFNVLGLKIFRRQDLLSAFYSVLKRELRSPNLLRISDCTAVELSAAQPISYQIDGDYGGCLPIRIAPGPSVELLT